MAQARRLLVETDLAVEEVGHRVGYRDPGYFVRTFRRSHGTTPLGLAPRRTPMKRKDFPSQVKALIRNPGQRQRRNFRERREDEVRGPHLPKR